MVERNNKVLQYDMVAGKWSMRPESGSEEGHNQKWPHKIRNIRLSIPIGAKFRWRGKIRNTRAKIVIDSG
jgi:hypothetical protein